MNCEDLCKKTNNACEQKDCKYWMDYSEDLNCTIICAKKNGPLTLRETAKRLGVSYVRIKQIEENALNKIKKKNFGSLENEYYL
jgi:DNA-directed RNA polymerase sigma subunit (sigma70/sigma32)